MNLVAVSCVTIQVITDEWVYEIMKISPAIKRLISKNADADDIKNQAIKEGMNTLKMAAANGVKEGITSIAEMIKATYEAEEEEENK